MNESIKLLLVKVHQLKAKLNTKRYFLIFLIGLTSLLLTPPDISETNENYRLKDLFRIGHEMSESFEKGIKWESNHDDLGLYFIMALSYISNGDEKLSADKAMEIWGTFSMYYIALISILLTVSWYVCIRVFGDMHGTLLLLLVCFSPHFRFLVFGMDVYIFTFFNLIAFWGVLKAMTLSFRVKSSWHLLIISSLFFGISCLFRITGKYLIVSIILFAVYKLYKYKSRYDFLKLFTSIFLIIGVMKLPSLITEKTEHIKWHALHAGLFEYGGLIDKETREPFPSFYPREKLVSHREYIVVNRWSDEIEMSYVSENFPGITYPSNQYEEKIKDHFWKLIEANPVGYLQLIGKRIIRTFNFSPFTKHTNDSYMMISLFDIVFSSIALILICFCIVKYKSILWAYFLLGFPVAAGSVLIHSGYIMYNYGVIVTLSFALYFSIVALLTKGSFDLQLMSEK